MKRFDGKDRDAPAGTRSGPRARAAQDRKFGAARAKPRDSGSADPYQRAERPPRAGPPVRDARFGERLRAPVRDGAIALDPDVARVFRDSEAVNEALRLVIRLARTVGGGARPTSSFDRARSGASAGARSGPPSGARSRPPSDRFSRDERPRRSSAPPVRREPKFEESE
jgi:hypothetical protein